MDCGEDQVGRSFPSFLTAQGIRFTERQTPDSYDASNNTTSQQPNDMARLIINEEASDIEDTGRLESE